MSELGSAYSDKMREYIYSNPQDEMALETIELRHVTFMAEDGVTPAAVRFVNDPDPLTATLEDDAAMDGGAEVEFLQGAFEITLPESNGPGLPTAQIGVDNVGEELTDPIKNSIGTPAPIELTYRQFLLSDTSEPAVVIDGLTIRKSNVNATKVTAQAGFDDDLNVPFGRALYTREEYPGLVR